MSAARYSSGIDAEPDDAAPEPDDAAPDTDEVPRPQVVFPRWFAPTLVALALVPVVVAAITATTRSWPASVVESWFGPDWAEIWRLRFLGAYLCVGGALVAALLAVALPVALVRRLRSPRRGSISE